ncbi:flavin-containing monooxygenase [Mycolicibacterium smegmatis]|uniref:Cyclohexanone monooxygenase n=1 Tax=Mycolicibacterium smegmatis (strain ATCC 700084 / mc(2)155) TaxID=246196 RepID=A0QWB6_MYCS2|nr:NAD(P)/FAD-dependent oxidoreductase [Mycolicibacterium smegmatis]ABK71859.1 cyclohexanone monooxygenase [Mycolicibacterium smegmatis MC2 155]AIU08042.1 cyclohexanone monooxygenase [Mycolicibacterium smegmatis MC2 155]AIU14667.1 cyclohexanone monooxygenase [Mycolicibacterium smegmatis]AIU21290.1 cyclohexanone monooxygenase [Mycolicibacterium smegmatis]MBE9621653.1 NAD(P)/FAD-dependent oxidoreductase [Mycolicibacterium smegmatis]
MTTDATVTADGTRLDADELRRNLRQADAGVLVAVLAQLTGDPAVVDRFAPGISHIPDPPEHIGVADDETLDQLVEAVVEAMNSPRPQSALPADDQDLFLRIAPLALGTPVGPEYAGLLLEQGGFHPSQPVLPRTAKLPPDFKVVIIGAGIAGMAAALELADAGVDFEIIDRNDEVGGTWYTTTYPGIGVDTPSAYYSLSRDVNGDWTSYYPQGPEYQNYLRAVADKNGLRDRTRFGTEVTALHWDEQRAQWQVHTVGPDGRRDVGHANVVIPAAGYLNRPRWPDLEGRETFGGISIHSAEWDPGLDLTGKKVAIIGAGCTAVQIVDACVDRVEHLTVFQRQPHWVAPRKRLSDDVPEHRRWLNNHVPFHANWVRLKSFWGTADNNHPVILRDPEWAAEHLSISKANDVLLQICLDYIDRTFGAGSELAAKVTPDFAPYGKRIIRDPGGYYAALTKPHVDVEAAEPARVNEAGIVTQDGRQIDLDVIIYATGYHLDFLSTVDIRGRNGVRLSEFWGDSPSAYRGGLVPGFPNLFISSAPNYSPGHGAGHNFGVEVMVHYVMECLQLMAIREATTLEVTEEAFTDYVRQIDEAMQNTVWCHTPTAHTYYRSGGGRIVTAFPFRLIDVWQSHRAPIEEDLTLS